MLILFRYIVLLGLVAIATGSKSQPLFSSSQMIGDQKVYRDKIHANLYYYLPLDYRLVKDANGKPDFSLTEMRYTGTKATGDEGVVKYHNLCQFRIAVDISQEQNVAVLRNKLRSVFPSAELKTLPVTKFSSLLVFAGTEVATKSDSIHMVKTGYSEATDEKGTGNNSYWNERIITIRLNNTDAQLVESALRNHQSVLSFSYAIYTHFSETDPHDLVVSGMRSIRKEIGDFFENETKDKKDSVLHLKMIKADAIELKIDPDQWPQAIQKYDINEKVPAKYPLFDVYCYDFNNELRPDLFMKKIEIKATSVNGSDVITDFSFKSNRPDIYAKGIRFAYAVRFDKPFYYKVTEVNTDGEASVTDWVQKRVWSEILDITSPPDKIVLKSNMAEQ